MFCCLNKTILPHIFVFFYINFNFKHTRKIFFELLFSIPFFYCLILIFLHSFTFLNSGCVIFLLKTCFESLSWSIQNLIFMMSRYGSSLQAGATPSYIVENRLEYISNFNWFLNWLDNYFFNKVSDFIIEIIFLIGVIYLVFL